MIGSLRGQVIDREASIERSAASEVLLEVSGVGYRVSVTAATLDRLRPESEVLLFVHHHIREADQKLFGFMSKEERVAFEGLLAAHGVGPSLALAVLSTHSAARLARILADNDLNALCEVPGVGKKTAQRLLIELRSTFVLPEIDGVAGAAANGHLPGPGASVPSPLDDVREALASLGYSGDEIRNAVAGAAAIAAADPALDSGQLLKFALRSLAGV